MEKTYVIPDIHGCFDLLNKAFEEIQKQECNRNNCHRVILLGDYIDRGPMSAQVIGLIRHGIEQGKPYFPLKGNHEMLMANAILKQEPQDMEKWLKAGGMETLASYKKANIDPLNDAKWMSELPLYIVDKHRVYIHAYAPHDISLCEVPENVLLNTRYKSGHDIGHKNKHVVHGHTIQKNGPELLINRSNLDGGAYYYGKLFIAVFDENSPGGPNYIKIIS